MTGMGLMGLIPFVLAGTARAQDTELTFDAGLAMVTQRSLDGRAAAFMGAGLRHAGERFSRSEERRVGKECA